MSIANNVERVRERIAAACASAHRPTSEVTLIAVTKTHPPERVLEAIEAGVQHFGENRVEESESKIPAVMSRIGAPVTWHMIGHVQSRKAKDVAPLFQLVHSIDSLRLAERFSRLMQERGSTLDVLMEMNVSGEASKSGFPAARWAHELDVRERLLAEIARVIALPGLRVRGLMTMAPVVDDMEDARAVFADLAALRHTLQEGLSVMLPELSMGMTDDYPVAVEEGATMVRVGRAIFGERTNLT